MASSAVTEDLAGLPWWQPSTTENFRLWLSGGLAAQMGYWEFVGQWTYCGSSLTLHAARKHLNDLWTQNAVSEPLALDAEARVPLALAPMLDAIGPSNLLRKAAAWYPVYTREGGALVGALFACRDAAGA